MGLDDIYYRQPVTPYQQTDAKLGEGFNALGTAVDQYRQRQQSQHSEAFKAHLQAVLNGSMEPEQAAASLKQHIVTNSQPAPQAPLAGPQTALPNAFPPNGGAGPMDLSRVQPPSDPGYATAYPQTDQEQRDYLARPVVPSKAIGNFGPYDRPLSMGPNPDASGFGRPPQTQMPQGYASNAGKSPGNFAPLSPEPAQRAPFINTEADVQSGMSLVPYAVAKKGGNGRDTIAEIRARGEEQRKGIKLRGEQQVGLLDMKNAERQVEQLAELGYKNDALDERSAFHVEQIRLGYAKLSKMESLLDKSLDFKRDTATDEKMKVAQRTVSSLYASRAQLIGSAFARTPEGQTMIAGMDDVLDQWQPVLDKYASAPSGGSTTSTQKRTTQGGQTKRTPFAQRVQELKAQGKSKQDAMKALQSEGYDLEKGE